MRILLLGAGMQGKAALHDLVQSEAVRTVVVADRDMAALEAHVAERQYGPKVECRAVDAADVPSLRALTEGVDVVIDLLPVPFSDHVLQAALEARVHLVNTNYATDAMQRAGPEAERLGVTLLPEMGMDPGIDLVLLGEAVRQLDSVTDIASYGAGIPAPEAADNPLRYKVSWTFDGVLSAYRRPGRLIHNGRVVELSPDDMFRPEHVHTVELSKLGALEAYPNGDALPYADLLHLDRRVLVSLGRYSMRWPGHAGFWHKLVALGLLDDEPVDVDGIPVDRKRYLAAALEPRLRYAEGEQDLGILLVDVAGTRGGRAARIVMQVVDRRDLTTGITAMGRLVGYTASIGAQLVGSGAIAKRGLLSPVTDVPYRALVDELRARGIQVSVEISD
jgi:lysine 6-dehydrogenase